MVKKKEAKKKEVKKKDIIQLERFVDVIIGIVIMFGAFVVYNYFKLHEVMTPNCLIIISLIVLIVLTLIQTVILAHVIRGHK